MIPIPQSEQVWAYLINLFPSESLAGWLAGVVPALKCFEINSDRQIAEVEAVDEAQRWGCPNRRGAKHSTPISDFGQRLPARRVISRLCCPSDPYMRYIYMYFFRLNFSWLAHEWELGFWWGRVHVIWLPCSCDSWSLEYVWDLFGFGAAV